MREEFEITKRLSEMVDRRNDCEVALNNAEATGAPPGVLDSMEKVKTKYDREMTALYWVLGVEESL